MICEHGRQLYVGERGERKEQDSDRKGETSENLHCCIPPDGVAGWVEFYETHQLFKLNFCEISELRRIKSRRWIFSSPGQRILAEFNEAIKCRPFPILNAGHQLMLLWIP